MNKPLLLLYLILVLLVQTTVCKPRSEVVEQICGKGLMANSTIFAVNFVAVLENVGSQVRINGSGVATRGDDGPNKNYALSQCYGDLDAVDCVLCFSSLRTILPQCFPYSAAHVYLDGCYMRVTNYSFFEEISGPYDKALCGNVTRKDLRFQESARRAVLDATARAPVNGGYAKSEMMLSGQGNESAYVLANCWRTLSETLCKACLENASASVITCFPWSEGRALHTGCFMRYSDVNFLNEVVPQKSGGRSKGRIIVAVVVSVSSAVVFAIGVAVALRIWKKRRLQKKRKGKDDSTILVKILHDISLNFKFSTLEKATASFDEANKLGQGGFGAVYKGVLADGREIAVKRLFFHNKHRAADFYNEVNIISSLAHRNLVKLLGCSCSGPESLLVYEFLPNKSLDAFLFDANRGQELNWKRRLEIIIGTAEGLAYLHQNSNTRIIHRDIKASNILLDLKFRAKIADFGLARSFQDDKSHISTAIAGTLGYMAPEYIAHGQLTEKADVYSFGVLILEMVTGRQNNRSRSLDYSDSLITSVWRHYQTSAVEELFDPNLMLHNYINRSDVQEEISRVVHIGLLCTQEIPLLRPFMPGAIEMLLKRQLELPSPTNPPFIDESTMELNDPSDDPSNPLNHTSQSGGIISQSAYCPSVVGSVVIAVGFYGVMWGKVQEEKINMGQENVVLGNLQESYHPYMNKTKGPSFARKAATSLLVKFD